MPIFQKQKIKVGDLVIVDQVFTRNAGGAMIDVSPFICKIAKIQVTPTFGNIYLLEKSDGNTLKVWYYEQQIKSVDMADDIMWKTWGDV